MISFDPITPMTPVANASYHGLDTSAASVDNTRSSDTPAITGIRQFMQEEFRAAAQNLLDRGNVIGLMV